MHGGAVVGGVIGSQRPVYDYWGETMNVASRLQSVAPVNGIAVSEALYFQLRGAVAFEPLQIELKGLGPATIYVAALDGEAAEENT
jgi:class 3 adenylate cyclase